MRPIRLTLLLLLAQTLFALELPPKPAAWVTDNGNILAPAEEQALNDKLEAVKQRTGVDMLVMTYPSLEGEELVDWTNRVANLWETKDDRALMLFVFVRDRKVQTQVGYGLEGDIPDAIAARVYREVLVPNFQQQKYYEGIDEALNQYVMRIDPAALQNIPQRAPVAQPRPVQRQPEPSGIPIETIIFIVVIFVFFILPMFGRRRGGCGGCIFPFWFPGGGWGGGGGGVTFGGGGGGFSVGGSWGGGGSSFGGGGAGGGW